MFSSNKRIFAGKQSLKPQPFCPYISNESGYLSLQNNGFMPATRSGNAFKPRPVYRDEKRYA